MIAPAALTLAAIVLAQAPQSGAADALASLYGRTLGAAAQCPAVAPERITAAAEKASAHVKALAPGTAAQSAAGAALSKGITSGRRDVESGAITCAQAESELGNLEHDLAAPH